MHVGNGINCNDLFGIIVSTGTKTMLIHLKLIASLYLFASLVSLVSLVSLLPYKNRQY